MMLMVMVMERTTQRGLVAQRLQQLDCARSSRRRSSITPRGSVCAKIATARSGTLSWTGASPRRSRRKQISMKHLLGRIRFKRKESSCGERKRRSGVGKRSGWRRRGATTRVAQTPSAQTQADGSRWRQGGADAQRIRMDEDCTSYTKLSLLFSIPHGTAALPDGYARHVHTPGVNVVSQVNAGTGAGAGGAGAGAWQNGASNGATGSAVHTATAGGFGYGGMRQFL